MPTDPITYAIGDVHGRLDLLERVLARVDALAPPRPYRVVMLGDYVDRGPDSKGVIDLLMRRQRDRPTICLKGNHEEMMLRALAGESGALDHWLDNGGRATLWSYGARPDADLRLDIPRAHQAWISDLPLTAVDSYRVFVHAGLAPGVPLERQDERHLLWIRERFLCAPAEALPAHVVHGHTPRWQGKPDMAELELLPHRTNLDTGAYATGVLSVGVFDPAVPGGPVAVWAITEG
jgi:serine/threonine protein phosphatase 1